MVDFIKLDTNSVTPKYLQIIDSIIHNISDGNIKIGDRIPSINKLSKDIYLSRDTVERAYRVLKKHNILVSVHGKGTYVAAIPAPSKTNVLFLVNKLSPFKMKLYNSFVKEMGNEYQVDLHSYHCDETLFLELLEKYRSNYNYFVILPHFRTKKLLYKGITDKVTQAINLLPKKNLLILDNKEPKIEGDFMQVYQDFEQDIMNALAIEKEKISKYNSLTLVYPKSTFYPYPKKILSGFKKYCTLNNFKFEIIEEVSSETIIKDNTLFITIEEDDLVNIIRKVRKSSYTIGKDVGVISYNDTPLKQLLGISVFSVDLDTMGEKAAMMIKENKKEKIKTPFNFIQRDSL
jgi:DNA-binding transcriptional regulator YhcF (GntR family)